MTTSQLVEDPASGPVDFISDNLQIEVNVMDAALEYGVEHIVPRVVMHHLPEVRAQPISESACLIRAAQLIASS